ncbi:MAG TPA: acyl carrier protein [Bryobacteraceae bacterium]|nr:acyl carrier protein [Bryobacteraceae bacterium]
MKERIRRIIRENARVPLNAASLDDSTDLYNAGMTSHASVVLMLALENEFDLEFPPALLSRSVFESVDSIAAAIAGLAPQSQEESYEHTSNR